MDTPPSRQPRRPSLVLTLACGVGFLAALQGFAFSYGPDYRKLAASAGAPWLPAFVLGTSLLSLGLLVLLWWRMRRWAMWGFLAVGAGQSVVWAHLGLWRPVMLVFPALIAGAAAWNWERLR